MPERSGLRVGRVLADIRGAAAGPCLVAVAGVHGNEPAGVRAALDVAASLDPARLRGRFVALAGNLPALAAGRRFLDRDLNRRWRPGQVATLRRTGPDPRVSEDVEQLALIERLDPLLDRDDVYLVDLHTTSGPGPPFTTFGDTLANRNFAGTLPVPMVLGLEEQVAGTLLEYVDSMGRIGIAFEGGQHRAPEATASLAHGLRIALAAAGLVDRVDPGVQAARRRLRTLASGLPSVVEMRYRHAVLPGDRFRMRPGFTSFDPVTVSDAVARTATGDVRVPETGRILMPRYQPQGDDGYFLVREVRPFWLRLSAMLRRLRLDRVAHLLPGVRRHPRLRGGIVLDLRVARWYGLELFHLLGFRRRRRVGSVLVLVRRMAR
jgi:succinylglutamate desuccinylase